MAHYREPSYYTKSYVRRTADVAFYIALAARVRGRVLEYGCGNGRITVPIAAIGRTITGVDHSKPMLDDMRERLKRAPVDVRERIELVQGDMRSVRLSPRFDLVLCTFNTLLHLYERDDVERFLARVKAHMKPGGRFVFDVSMPSPSELARDPTRGYRIPPMRFPATGELVRYSEYFDYDAVRQILFVTMRFEPVDAPQRAWTQLLAHRQYYPHEIEALLHYNGFEIESVTSDFGSEPLHRYSDSAVYTARLRRRSRSAAR
jgi:SAM-dependent methyltransferase